MNVAAGSALQTKTSPSRIATAADVARSWSINIAVATLVTSALTVVSAPDVQTWALLTVILSLPIMGCGILCMATSAARSRVGVVGTRLTLGRTVFLLVAVAGVGVSLWLTEYASSVQLASRRGLAFFFVVNVIGLGLAWLAKRVVDGLAVGPAVAPTVGAIGALVFGCLGFVLDRSIFLAPFWPPRHVQVALEPIIILFAVSSMRQRGWCGGRSAIVAVAVAVGAVAIAASLRGSARTHAIAAVMEGGGSGATIVRYLRTLSDRDGDGFSAWLDGGDCDDHDANAFPQGPKDCDGLLAGATSPRAPAFATTPVRKVLVITIDAWRCRLANDALCPALGARSGDASFVGWQRVFAGQTVRSLSVLLGGPMTPDLGEATSTPSPIVGAANRVGYFSEAIYPLPQLAAPSVGGLFTVRDDSIFSRFDRAYAAQVAALVRREIKRATAERQLFFVHFLDPHAPYVPIREGEKTPWLLFGREHPYEVEVRRTDAAVAALVDDARRAGFDHDAAIIVTGDHGESFDHGHTYHGTSMFDDELKVPLFVWVFDADGRVRPLRAQFDPTERDVASLLADLVGVARPVRQSSVSAVLPLDGRAQQYAVVEDGWKLIYHRHDRFEELYDLHRDPHERINVIDRYPAQRDKLRQRLGAELKAVFGRQN